MSEWIFPWWYCCYDSWLWWWFIVILISLGCPVLLNLLPRLGFQMQQIVYYWGQQNTSLRRTFLSRPLCQNNLSADQRYDSEGHFAWPALRIWSGVHDPSRNFFRRKFFGRRLWGKGVGKPMRKNFCPGCVINHIVCLDFRTLVISYDFLNFSPFQKNPVKSNPNKKLHCKKQPYYWNIHVQKPAPMCSLSESKILHVMKTTIKRSTSAAKNQPLRSIPRWWFLRQFVNLTVSCSTKNRVCVPHMFTPS